MILCGHGILNETVQQLFRRCYVLYHISPGLMDFWDFLSQCPTEKEAGSFQTPRFFFHSFSKAFSLIRRAGKRCPDLLNQVKIGVGVIHLNFLVGLSGSNRLQKPDGLCMTFCMTFCTAFLTALLTLLEPHTATRWTITSAAALRSWADCTARLPPSTRHTDKNEIVAKIGVKRKTGVMQIALVLRLSRKVYRNSTKRDVDLCRLSQQIFAEITAGYAA